MSARGRIRIVGGLFRRTIVPVPGVEGLRPTPDRVRETVFNWLDADIVGAHCLDLFAGSGALGIEAASRGAAAVLVNDSNRSAHASVKSLVDKLLNSADEATARAAAVLDVRNNDAVDLLNVLQAERRQFDLVFIDPPFRTQHLQAIEPLVAGLLAPQGRIYLESDESVTEYAGLRTARHKKAGQVHYHLLNTI